jgi:hypothetical protein
MKKILITIVFIIVSFMIIQAIRYNYEGRNVKNFEFSELNNNVVVLNDVFDKTEDKLILYTT